MISQDEDEVLGIVQRMGPVVLSAATDMSGTVGTCLHRSVVLMTADPNMTELAVFQLAFGICVDLARSCKATLTSMDRVRQAAIAETPVTVSGRQTVDAVIQLALAQLARIVSAMTFASRDEVDTVASALNDAFAAAEEVACDNLDQANYMGLINLHGAVIAHLADVGRVLPRVITYSYQMIMPSLRMAQRAYGDPSRGDELIAENAIVHPAFCPTQGKMLAV